MITVQLDSSDATPANSIQYGTMQVVQERFISELSLLQPLTGLKLNILPLVFTDLSSTHYFQSYQVHKIFRTKIISP